MNKKIFFLVLGLFATILILLAFMFARNEKKGTTIATDPTPTSKPSPTVVTDPTAFTVLSTNPPEEPIEPYLPIQQVYIKFSEPVDPKDLVFETDPKTSTTVRKSTNPTELIVASSTGWTEGKTTITILQKTTSVEGKSLARPFTYILYVGYPKTADPDSDI